MSRPYKFAIVDDDKMIVQMIAQLMEDAGFDYVLFHGASCALVDIVNEKPDCVITDINMPGFTGLELIKEIKDEDHMENCKFIIITSLLDQRLKEEARKIGAHGYIMKPFDTDHFMEQVRAICKI